MGRPAFGEAPRCACGGYGVAMHRVYIRVTGEWDPERARRSKRWVPMGWFCRSCAKFQSDLKTGVSTKATSAGSAVRAMLAEPTSTAAPAKRQPKKVKKKAVKVKKKVKLARKAVGRGGRRRKT